jgi:hypothetical protein
MSTFFSPEALTSLRAAGYKNTQFALAELIDNAFDAEAKIVKIIFFEKKDHQDKRIVEEIIVCDDGTGMDKQRAGVCLQFGNSGNKDMAEIVAKKKKGMYGFGLPNASLSQCPCVHVFSRQKGGKFLSTYLDLVELNREKSIDIPTVKEVDLPAHYVEAGGVVDDKKGTIVAWRNCDNLSNTRASTLLEKSERVLGRLYRHLLNDGKTITLESWEMNPSQGKYVKTASIPVVANDPLFLMESTYIARILHEEANATSGIADPKKDPATYYKEFSLGKKKCRATNHRLPDHCFDFPFEWAGKTYQFTITTTIADKRIQKPGIREGGRTPVGTFYGQKEHISFVRAGREISTGNYDLYKATEPRHRWWSIEVQFTPDADRLLGVHNNKQGIEFVKTEHEDPTEEWNKTTGTLQQAREHLWIKLTNLLAHAIKEARKEVLKIEKDYDTTEGTIGPGAECPGLPSGTATTIEAILKDKGEKQSQFSEEEKKELFKRLRDNYPDVDKQEIEASIEKFDQWRVRGVVLYFSSKGNSLWELTTAGQFLIVLINTEHEFYKRVICPLRVNKIEQAVASIELFISSLAWEEHEHFTVDEKKKDTIEAFRNYAGLHLNTYLKDNDIAIDEDQLAGPQNCESSADMPAE